MESVEMGAFGNTAFRILCVDDEPDLLADIAEELRDHGYVVDTATDGEEALRLIAEHPPELIVSDMLMPNRDGRQLLSSLRTERSDLAKIPFIFLTAITERDTVIEARKQGADDYLSKPIDFGLLLAIVEGHAKNSALRNQSSKDDGLSRAKAQEQLAILNTREREILTGMAQGKQNKVIAFDLSLSTRTIEVYRANLLKRLGVRSSAEAVAIAVEAGLHTGT